MYNFFACLLFLFSVNLSSFSVVSNPNREIENNILICKDLEVNLLPNVDNNFRQLDKTQLKQILIEKIVYKSDITMSDQDWKDVTGLKENQLLDIKDLKKICLFLKRKNKFKKLIITIEKGKAGYILKLAVKSFWTFKRLILKGNVPDKQAYIQKYLISGSEVFDISKHKHSIENIKQELYDNGYFNIIIHDSINYDKTTKEVTVNLFIDKVEKFIINSINMNFEYGQNFEDKEKFEDNLKKTYISKLNGKYFNKQDIISFKNEIANNLLLSGYLDTKITFENKINEEKKTVDIDFKISIPSLKQIIFSGNKFFSTQDIWRSILIPETSSALVPPFMLVDDIIELYKNKGFWNIDINLKEEKNKYVFNIIENNPVKIKKVINKAPPESEFSRSGEDTKKEAEEGSFVSEKSLVKTDISVDELFVKNFKDLCDAKQYDKALLDQSLDNLTNEYIKKGFWDFRIEKQEFVDLGNDVFQLELTISRGVQRLLSDIKIPQLKELEKEEIFKPYINLEKAIPFDMQIIYEQQKWLLKYLKSKGFLYSQVKPELKFDPKGIALIWQIDNNIGKILFGKTIVEGSNAIGSSILLRELQYKEGEPFDVSKVEATKKKLRNLSVFESVSLSPLSNEVGNYRTMLLKYTPDFPFELRARAGYQQVSKSFTHQSGSTYKLGGSFLWKNPLAIADKLRADIDFTRFLRNISLSYEMPWIFNQPVRTLIRFYSTLFAQPPFNASHERLYKSSQEGLMLDFNRIFHYGVFRVCTGIEWQKLFDVSDRLARIIQFEPALIDQKTPYFCFEPILELEYRDNKSEPKTGGCTSITAKCMLTPKIREGSYLKLTVEQSLFYPIFRDCVIGAVRFRVGHIFNQNFNTILPTERYYLGGSSTLRGYETDMVPPLNSFIGINGERFWVPIGGKSMLNINTEIRFPIYNKLSGVVFTDAGALTDTKITDIRGNSIYAATGFGVRYSTPFGPIRFDIGFKWKKRSPQDRSYAWFLTFGHTF